MTTNNPSEFVKTSGFALQNPSDFASVEYFEETNMDNSSSTAFSFEELYISLLFLVCLYIMGDIICGKIIKFVPSLVGQIITGILFGPNGLGLIDVGSIVRCWSILGTIGLILLLCQAGLEMDIEIIRMVGIRGVIMAMVGSLLPISIGITVCFVMFRLPLHESIAAGCAFGPTSAGIAMNVLAQCDVLQTSIGQLVVAIAIVDDIIALIVLSQLRALTSGGQQQGSDITIASVVTPIACAVAWLFLGGAIALWIMPHVLVRLEKTERYIYGILLKSNNSNEVSDSKNGHKVVNEQVNATNHREIPTKLIDTVVNSTIDVGAYDDGDNDQRKNYVIGMGNTPVDNTITNQYHPRDTATAANVEANKNNTGRQEKSIKLPSSSQFHFCHIITLLLCLLPATNYTNVSYLLGAFLAGLCGCELGKKKSIPQSNDNTSDNGDDYSDETVVFQYNNHLNLIIQWLLRVFFGATIGMEIPIQLLFGSSESDSSLSSSVIIVRGLALTLALFGKVLTGFLLTPVFLSSCSRNTSLDNSSPTTTPSPITSAPCAEDSGKDNSMVSHSDIVNDNGIDNQDGVENGYRIDSLHGMDEQNGRDNPVDKFENCKNSLIDNNNNDEPDTEQLHEQKQTLKRHRYDAIHLRDCCIVGFSMAGEAEFAFLVARFGYEEKIFDVELYASITFAIFLSTIISPVLLRITLSLYPLSRSVSSFPESATVTVRPNGCVENHPLPSQ